MPDNPTAAGQLVHAQNLLADASRLCFRDGDWVAGLRRVISASTDIAAILAELLPREPADEADAMDWVHPADVGIVPRTEPAEDSRPASPCTRCGSFIGGEWKHVNCPQAKEPDRTREALAEAMTALGSIASLAPGVGGRWTREDCANVAKITVRRIRELTHG